MPRLDESKNPTREEYVNILGKFIGLHEGTSKFKEFIDDFNKLQKTYKMGYTSPWCACFVSYLNLKSGGNKYSSSFPVAISCDDMIAKFKKKGRYIDTTINPTFIPQQGDTIFYNLDNNLKNGCEHTGVVFTVANGDNPTISVIEGNKSDSVGIRLLNKKDDRIMGYGLPRFR